jgi:hypothetical protein
MSNQIGDSISCIQSSAMLGRAYAKGDNQTVYFSLETQNNVNYIMSYVLWAWWKGRPFMELQSGDFTFGNL